MGPRAEVSSIELPAGWTLDAEGPELRIRCGGLAPAPDLTSHGWRLRLVEDDLAGPTAADAAGPPASYELVRWSPTCRADAFAVYEAAFRERPGFPHWSQQKWLAWATEHDAFRPDLSYVLYAAGKPVGYAVGAIEDGEAWIVQMGVVPSHRRRGLGRVLIEHTREAAYAAGAQSLWLSVNLNNPGARALYERTGFVFRVRRAVYVS